MRDSDCFYVYEHIRPDTGQVFYVGKGKGHRARVMTTGRNQHHRNITNKLKSVGLSCEVRFVAESLPESSAMLLEAMRISMWRAARVPIVNLTTGGDGWSVSEEVKAKLRTDITGKRYGRLTAIKRVGASAAGKSQWRFECDCGATDFVAVFSDVLSGRTQSCGCLNAERRVEANTHHGHTPFGGPCSKTYNAWNSMHNSCRNPNTPGYKTCGAKGIKVCERWSAFSNFLADMGEKPDGLVLTRIDRTKDYTPDNCIYVDRKTSVAHRKVDPAIQRESRRKYAQDNKEHINAVRRLRYQRGAA